MRIIPFFIFLLFLAETTFAKPFKSPYTPPEAIFDPSYEGLPPGNYLPKCKSCTVDNDGLLVCYCPKKMYKRKDQYFLRSLSTNRCQNGFIALRNSYLFCEKKYADEDVPRLVFQNEMPLLETSEDMPKGDYRYYCRQSSLGNKNQLTTSCMIPGFIFDDWETLTLDLNSCSSTDDVTYANGQLFCNNKEMLKTLSDFVKSCRNCVIQGDTLYCRCDKTRCDWSIRDRTNNRHIRKTALPGFRACSSKIINCNGYLRCGSCGLTDFWDESRRPYEGHSDMKSCNTFYLPF